MKISSISYRFICMSLFASLFLMIGQATSTPDLNAQVADGSTWVTFAPIPIPVQEFGAVLLNGEIYVVGGFLGNTATTGIHQIYNPETDTWREAARLPVPLHHTGVAVVDDKYYVIGGYRSGFIAVDTVYEYDPVADAWSEKASMKAPRGGLAAVNIGGLIYAVGGEHVNSESTLAVYNPASDTWADLPPMSVPRDHIGAVAIDEKIYVAGGRNRGNFILDDLEIYDTATRTWQKGADMPTGRSGVAAVAYNGCFYVFGGEGNPLNVFGIFPQVERYDPTSNEWTELLPMAEPRHGFMAVVVGNRIHFPSGAPILGFSVTEVNDALEIPDDVACSE